MNLLHFCLLLLLLLLRPGPAAGLSPDGLSLLALKSAVSPDASPFADWNDTDPDPCSWPGISCLATSGSPAPRVVAVAIPNRKVRGYLPSELGSLAFLSRLDLRGNRFSGTIPAQLFNATSLRSVILYNNNLSGPLPPQVGNLSHLQALDLSRNSLSGEIPRNLGSCLQLQRLSLSNNRLYGEIPAGLWPKLKNLVQLDLSDNELEGSLPEDLGELKLLSGTLNFSFNRLSGKLPVSLGKLPETAKFDLRNNDFTGEIPRNGTFANQSPSAFIGNPGLCSFLLKKPCNGSYSKAPAASGDSAELGDHPMAAKRGLKSSSIIIIAIVDAIGVAFIGLTVVWLYWKRRESRICSCTGRDKLGKFSDGDGSGSGVCACAIWRGISRNSSSETGSEKGGEEEAEEGGGGDSRLVALDKGFKFELEELLRASAYVLGRSGPGGIVYKVVLGNGIPVAVRRLGDGGEHRYKEFAAAARVVGRIRHPNVVRLRAFYWAPDEKLLISDFIANGNLATALHGRAGQKPPPGLLWSTRLRIARGIAQGLAYIHEYGQRKYTHGDIKPANILLDAGFDPHIANFGLAQLLSITGSGGAERPGGFIGSALPSAHPALPERTQAYRAPEARGPGSQPTQKSDVYSFGLVLLEMLTAKSAELFSPSAPSPSETGETLVGWVRKELEEERPASELMDPALPLGEGPPAKKEAIAALHVGIACTESDPELRPRMKTVSENLERIGH